MSLHLFSLRSKEIELTYLSIPLLICCPKLTYNLFFLFCTFISFAAYSLSHFILSIETHGSKCFFNLLFWKASVSGLTIFTVSLYILGSCIIMGAFTLPWMIHSAQKLTILDLLKFYDLQFISIYISQMHIQSIFCHHIEVLFLIYQKFKIALFIQYLFVHQFITVYQLPTAFNNFLTIIHHLDYAVSILRL